MQPTEFPDAKKPPLGLIPKWLWLEKRKADVESAIKRYSDAKMNIPSSWVNELKEIEIAMSK
jgi:hypothetical protein